MCRFLTIALLATCCAQVSHAQFAPNVDPSDTPNTSHLEDGSQLSTSQSQFAPLLEALSQPPISEQPDFAKLLIPSFNVAAEWQAEVNQVELISYDARVTIPTYPIFGPPPPFLNAGFSYFDLNAPAAFDLPTDLYDYSLGFGWMRRINDRWMLRLMFSTALATDGKNNSSDAWQFRGGLFAMYRPNEQWTWIVGALALGRKDIPAVPAVGAIWQPTPALRFDLTLPKPKAAFLLADQGARQQWGYIGGGFEGGTWAYEASAGLDDQLTYRDWRVVVGWESTPTPEPGMPFTRGRKLGVEVGYVFAREFEFGSGRPDLGLDDSLLIRATASF
jgi:hypothetical protein